jgi:hypothetical protein
MKTLIWMAPLGVFVNASMYAASHLLAPAIWSFGVVFVVDSAIILAFLLTSPK